MYLQRAEVQNFRGIRHLTIDFEKDTTVLIGENAWGKSSLLSALYMVLGQGHRKLCRFSPDDLYIPIRLTSDYEEYDTQQSPAATSGSAGAGQSDREQPSAEVSAHARTRAAADRAAVAPAAAAAAASAASTSTPSGREIHGEEKLIELGLQGAAPIKVINTPSYQRRYYSVPNPSGNGRILHIVDFPCEQTDSWSSRCEKLSRGSRKGHGGRSRSHSADHGGHGRHCEENQSPLTIKERIARVRSTLDQSNELNPEGLRSIQEDLSFFSTDVYKDNAEKIVIDLFFCENKYGQLNSIERFACLRNVSWLGEDGRWRIHYRVSASFVRAADDADSGSDKDEFVTVHELLNENRHPYQDCEEQIRQLILLNPLLRLRDRRMYKPLDPAEHKHMEQDESFSMASGTSIVSQDFESETYQAISHFFANITTDEDLNSARMNDAVEVLNTIASKYLTSYQTSFGNSELNPVSARPRTAREIISSPVSIASLSALKAAVDDAKPSRSKLLLSLLAGALLMSKGQREIDEFSRPVLILEDIESRFHPTLLLNFWAILQVLPVQKVVTTNSSQLIAAISLNSLRRLCKQYYDVRCYRIREKAFSVDDERKIAFHIRMSRPAAIFARCWILVEGETEVWLLNEMASVLGINLACNGIRLIEFAQCGLYPLMRLARQLGISFHVLTDGDDAGKHYASTVRDLVGSRALPDHLSVMPHVDIEHYMYTSGFADVYQKAAGLTLRQISSVRTPDFISDINVSDLIDSRCLKEALNPDNIRRALHSETDAQADDAASEAEQAAAPAPVPEQRPAAAPAPEDAAAAAHKHTEQTDAQGSLASLSEHDRAVSESDSDESAYTADEVTDASATAREACSDSDSPLEGEIRLRRGDYILKHHTLNTLIKTLMKLNINDTADMIKTIVKKGKHRGRSSGSEVLDITEISSRDVSDLESYLTRQISKMSHTGTHLTARQTRMLNRSRNLCARLMKQARKNENLAEQQWRHDCKQAEQQNKKLRYDARLRDRDHQQHAYRGDSSAVAAAATAAAAARAAALQPGHGRRTRTAAAHSLTPVEQLQALKNIKALAEKTLMHMGNSEREHKFEREVGRAANALYGALDDQGLSRNSMNANKAISQAIHKTTKPGLAILVGEAMQQRGADSVPLMFRTMFRRIRRMAHDESGIN